MNNIEPNMQSNILEDKASKRIYVTKLCNKDVPHIIEYLNNISSKNGATKIIVKVPATYCPLFIQHGFQQEAYIPRFFTDKTDVVFMCKYLNEERKKPEKEHLKAFQGMFENSPSTCIKTLNREFQIRELDIKNIPAMISVFKAVFESYPFPIFDAHFLQQSMLNGTRYFGVFAGTELIAVSSAECDTVHKNAEMTDFAVLPTHRGMCLASHLLTTMEQTLLAEEYHTVYTIARLYCIPMNKTFYNAQYQFSGTLTQNTQISGSIQSMNVWYKHLEK